MQLKIGPFYADYGPPKEWMAATELSADDSRWIALRDFLESNAGSMEVAAISDQIISPPSDLGGGDATAGRATHAIIAQSIGGGGGNGGWAGSVAINAGDGASIGIAIGGTGGDGGNSGAVTLNSGIGVAGDTVETHGAGASGLF